MPFTDTVSSMSGRNSRASNVSGMTGASHSVRSGPLPAKSNDTMSNVGVLSMLKTSTDTGDIGALSINQTRLPTLPRPSHQRRTHAHRPSMGSSHHYPSGPSSHHHYAPSQTSRISDSTSFARKGSFTSMQSMPPSLPPVGMGPARLQMPQPAMDRSGRESRSYSMTSAPAGGQLPRHRSASSLKSAGHAPRDLPRIPMGHPPMPENRPPYVYPTRLKRPGYRSPSPALSDLSSQGYPMSSMPSQPYRRPSGPPQRPQPVSHHSDYVAGYGQDGHPIHPYPPPRTMSTSPPIMGYEQQQYGYHPSTMRSGQPPMPPQHPPQQHTGYRGPPPGPGPSRPYYAGAPYGPPRPGYPPQPPMQYSGYPPQGHRGPPPPANMMPMAHSMFHNAARMARDLPHRTDTPMTGMSPPSSDPPSSGTGATAPTSSSPPTPKDQSTIQVAVDPLFIDPALTDLPDSSSEPVLPLRYLEFADGKHGDEPELQMHHASVPPIGFVQRVKAMLESKAAVEAAAQREAEKAGSIYHAQQLEVDNEMTDFDISDLHELAANETPRFTIIEEFDAPVELPASPVKVSELPASPVQPSNRLTRELIQAELSPTSTDDQSTTPLQIGDSSTEMVIRAELQREPSRPTNLAAVDEMQPAVDESLSTPTQKRQNSVAGTVTTASTIENGISSVDYALRFSMPLDTTMQSEETDSRDPFILDADTITLEHQRSKDTTPQPEEDVKCEEPRHDLGDPVSPLRPNEANNRSSAVSPYQTQTLGIDETLRLGSNTRQDDTSTTMDHSTLDVTMSTEETLPPPTPRTPRTYSKSVQLPQSTSTSPETTTTNRYSLPPDLSTVAEISRTNTTSDMITDVAVRFSLPNGSVTVGKPQIVTIPPSSSPEKPESPPPKSKARGLDPKGHRSSVTFADQIKPLNVKKAEPRREVLPANEGAASKGKSIIRRPSPIDLSSASSRSQDSTTELRFPVVNGGHGKFGSTHLPGLKEESVEDMSITEHHKRSSSRIDAHGPQLPARIAAVKAMQERRLQETAEKAKARRAARHHNRPLAEIRDLPSLNFSRMDLIDRLNEALETRPSQSLELVRHRDFSTIHCPSPQRPQSTEPLRDRYTSFFSKPEDFSSFFDAQDEEDSEDDEPTPEHVQEIPIVEVQESTKIEEDEEPGSRAMSPEDLLSVATQVNRLSIPSMSGLSDKLTSLLPCLRNLHLDSVISNDDEIAHILDDIHHLGNGGRPDTVMSTRTSAGFRTLAERAEEIVLNGTHDSLIPMSRRLMDKELPALPESASADHVSALNSADEKQSYLSGSVSAPSNLGKELPARPSSALIRHTPISEEEVRQLLPPEMNPITRSKRSLIISSASRPWNQDENYPWSGSEVPVDLTIPTEIHTLDSSELVRVTRTELTSGDPTDTRGIDIGSIFTIQDCSASIGTEQATGINKADHLRTKSKRSIIGSISKKIGLAGRSHVDDTISNTRSLASPALRSEDSIPHKPGERYPTSGLTPPANIQLDEVRSFFSDNSSERHRNSTFPKRFTKLRKSKGVRLESAARTAASMDGNNTTTYDAGSMAAERVAGATSSAQTYDGVVGMGKAEFRIKRLGEKLRHLFVKSGELIRSLSKNSRSPRGTMQRDDWLSDSLYSGV